MLELSSVRSEGLAPGGSSGWLTGGSSSMMRIRRITPLSCHSYTSVNQSHINNLYLHFHCSDKTQSPSLSHYYISVFSQVTTTHWVHIDSSGACYSERTDCTV